ncbi:hypothetical protein MMC30_006722 [Trapelia coarctata]|nr:hypothetical protein [Trapelia coarctata]
MNDLEEICPSTNSSGQSTAQVWNEQTIGVFLNDPLHQDGRRKLLPNRNQWTLRDLNLGYRHIWRRTQEYYKSTEGQNLFHSNSSIPEFQNLCRTLAEDYHQNLGIPQLEWYIMNCIYSDLRNETVKPVFVDISEPRSWPNWFRDEFLRVYKSCSEDFPTNAAINSSKTANKVVGNLNMRFEPPSSGEIDYTTKRLPTGGKLFFKKEVDRAVALYQKWGFIRGEAAEQFIEIDGEQLGLANHMLGGDIKDQVLERKHEKMQIHGGGLEGVGFGTLPDSP